MRSLTLRTLPLLLVIPLATQADPFCGTPAGWARNTAFFGGVLGIALSIINGIESSKVDELARQNPQVPALGTSRNLQIATTVTDAIGGIAGIFLFGASKLQHIRNKHFKAPMVTGLAMASLFPLSATMLSGFNAGTLAQVNQTQIGASVEVPKNIAIISSVFSGMNTGVYWLGVVTAALITQNFEEF